VLLQKDTAEVQPLVQPQDVQYPWQLKCCSQNGETRLYHMPEKDATSLYFAGRCPVPLGLQLACLRKYQHCRNLWLPGYSHVQYLVLEHFFISENIPMHSSKS